MYKYPRGGFRGWQSCLAWGCAGVARFWLHVIRRGVVYVYMQLPRQYDRARCAMAYRVVAHGMVRVPKGIESIDIDIDVTATNCNQAPIPAFSRQSRSVQIRDHN